MKLVVVKYENILNRVIVWSKIMLLIELWLLFSLQLFWLGSIAVRLSNWSISTVFRHFELFQWYINIFLARRIHLISWDLPLALGPRLFNRQFHYTIRYQFGNSRTSRSANGYVFWLKNWRLKRLWFFFNVKIDIWCQWWWNLGALFNKRLNSNNMRCWQ